MLSEEPSASEVLVQELHLHLHMELVHASNPNPAFGMNSPKLITNALGISLAIAKIGGFP